MVVSLCIIATNRYTEYVWPLIASIEKYFLPKHKITIHLFSDKSHSFNGSERINVVCHFIPSYTFPDATLKRFEIMTSVPKDDYGDHIFYIDADMSVIANVGELVLGYDIVAVLHPGYFNNKNCKGTWEERPESMCYVPPERRLRYFAGGFSGGKTDNYFGAMLKMKEWIDTDLAKNIVPIWHDESAWNCWLSINAIDSVINLSPAFCMPEPMEKRIAWGINHFEPKILALEKPKNFRE